MKHFLHLLKHEIRTLFIAPATYTAAVLFLLLMGYIYYLILDKYSHAPQHIPPLQLYFNLFWIPVFFITPLLTMRSFAEERRLGTLETLMTTPVSAAEVVISKYTAAYAFYCALWTLSLGFPLLTVWAVGRPEVTECLLAPGVLAGGCLFVGLSGLFFIAVGIFSSSLTRSQLVAGMLCFCLLFVFIAGLPALKEQTAETRLWWHGVLDYLQIFRHLEDFSRGVVDSRPVIYYLSNTALVLGLSTLVVEAKT